ncbi:MAG: type II toxin-antitoxin system Phd/YefM family antitoxin [bacterium]|nr:type II toxin-antitoxin system Phd/YefM family antitoxin [bacterium]
MFPKTTTARDIQRNYRKVFDEAKKSKEPVFVMKNNKPDVAIIDATKLEEMEAVLAVLESREEARVGKAKVLNSLEELWNEAQED